MEKKKALLVVAGGRAAPDVLALFHVQPCAVVFITSEEGWRDEQAFINIASAFPSCVDIQSIPNVNAYEFEKGKQACMEACLLYPEDEWEWTFAISSAPKVTGIAAYEVAKQRGIPCLYIDTQHEKIVSFVKDIGLVAKDLFHMSVRDYMKIQRREPETYKPEKLQYRATAEKWGHIAQILAFSPETPSFIKLMHDKKERVKVPLLSAYLAASSLVKELETLGVIKVEHLPQQEMTCEFTSSYYAKFVGTGDWLEVYVWYEANKASFADDCQWGYKFVSTANNELDVALTYKAQFIFAECKTEGEPFQNKIFHLDTINTKAEMLGRTYVTKLFITNEPKTRNGYTNFIEQAKLRGIVVATQEDLPNIGQILKREALTPTYPRI